MDSSDTHSESKKGESATSPSSPKSLLRRKSSSGNVPPLSPRARAIQVVTIDEDGTRFELDQDDLNQILGKIPGDTKVATVSVVGAFRTGKSFLLDFFLRYLRYRRDGMDEGVQNDEDDAWMRYGNEHGLEGNANPVSRAEVTSMGFSWRAGRERNTTGIWIWSEPFIFKDDDGDDVAVLLIDTQGMFDSKTTQMLTASIFGLSTLLSSYQIYNVDKRIQEDNLQHLALFSEYGRLALAGSTVLSDDEEDNEGSLDTLKKELKLKALAEEGDEPTSDSSSNKSNTTEEGKAHASAKTKSNTSASEGIEKLKQVAGEQNAEANKNALQPFQMLEFLVRDWQNFDDEEDGERALENMKEYMEEVMGVRSQTDLAETREQINACFEEVRCFLLPHPGFEVTSKDYSGDVSKIRVEFRKLLSRYVRRVLRDEIKPKRIGPSVITAKGLLNYVIEYVALFHEAKIFPEAKTLLEATAEANNRNALQQAFDNYVREMDRLAGPRAQYVPDKALRDHHSLCLASALRRFDSVATMGRAASIKSYRADLCRDLDDSWERYKSTNEARDPYKNLELYVIPGIIAAVAMVAAWVNNAVCFEEAGIDIPVYDCKTAGQHLGFIYWSVVFFMIIVAFATGSTAVTRVKMLFRVLTGAVTEEAMKGTQRKKQKNE